MFFCSTRKIDDCRTLVSLTWTSLYVSQSWSLKPRPYFYHLVIELIMVLIYTLAQYWSIIKIGSSFFKSTVGLLPTLGSARIGRTSTEKRSSVENTLLPSKVSHIVEGKKIYHIGQWVKINEVMYRFLFWWYMVGIFLPQVPCSQIDLKFFAKWIEVSCFLSPFVCSGP